MQQLHPRGGRARARTLATLLAGPQPAPGGRVGRGLRPSRAPPGPGESSLPGRGHRLGPARGAAGQAPVAARVCGSRAFSRGGQGRSPGCGPPPAPSRPASDRPCDRRGALRRDTRLRGRGVSAGAHPHARPHSAGKGPPRPPRRLQGGPARPPAVDCWAPGHLSPPAGSSQFRLRRSGGPEPNNGTIPTCAHRRSARGRRATGGDATAGGLLGGHTAKARGVLRPG